MESIETFPKGIQLRPTNKEIATGRSKTRIQEDYHFGTTMLCLELPITTPHFALLHHALCRFLGSCSECFVKGLL